MRTALILAIVCSTSVASADIRINEYLFDAPGTDQGQEFFEIRSSNPSAPLGGLWLLAIEGDGAAAGTVDQAFDMSAFSTGANGLFLWRDAATVLTPAPEAATVVNVADFNPDVENGTNSYVLVSAFSGLVGQDLDTNNDGVLDLLPWGSVLDAVAVTDLGAGDWMYAGSLGGVDFTGLTFTPDGYSVGVDGVRYAYDVLGAAPGPYAIDALEISPALANAVDFTATPGSGNALPAPGAAALLGCGVVLIGRRRR